MRDLLYGAAYYEEYLPYDRLQEDIQMMKKAGMNVVRIAESTWSTLEPSEGVFDPSHIVRVLDAMEQAGMAVIIGTPTYAIPAWMVRAHPDILAETKEGRGIYGARQIMDITHPAYRFYCERVIRKLMECSAHRACVIGFQLDNETKYYGTAGPHVQQMFVAYLKEQFHGDLEAMNQEFGLAYWSNRINAWEEFPDVRGTINGSLGAEFEKFQRTLVDQFLFWQSQIVGEYKREDQFVTQNFDLEWRGHSFGIQPSVNHKKAAQALTIAGVDIYHPSQHALTGKEIAFGGDLARSLKQDNYLVLETEAQGYPGWTPYPGQLKLQAYSHLAAGANSVMYWHWHSLHNSFETYWKGILSHDFEENETYLAAKEIGNEWKNIGSHLVNLKKENRVGILVSNEALTALEWFPIDAEAGKRGEVRYNDVLRYIYDRLFELNVECDLIWPDSDQLEQYDLVVVPALYAAEEKLLRRLNAYAAQGGHLFVTFKSAFANEHVKVSHEQQPHLLQECVGAIYHQFCFPNETTIEGAIWKDKEWSREDRGVRHFMELLIPQGATVLARYQHPAWNQYAAVTRNAYGRGCVTYLGCFLSDCALRSLLLDTCKEAGIIAKEDERDGREAAKVIIRQGRNEWGHALTYYMNYSAEERQVIHIGADGRELLTDSAVKHEEVITIGPWGVSIVEQSRR